MLQIRKGRLSVLLISLLTFLPLTAAQVELNGVSYTPEDTLPTDEGIRSGVLDNGMAYYLRFNDEPRNRADMALVVGAGSLVEDDDQQGIAHFLEHMLFNGTENFEGQEIINFLERIGMSFGPDVNAYTSFEETVYTLEVPLDSPDVVSTAFDILADWAVNATLDPEEIDKERGVIVEEERARNQNVNGRLTEALLPVLLGGSRYAERLPIGDMDTVRSAPREVFTRYYETYYRPDNMAIVAVGDFDLDAFEQRITETFASLENPAEPLAETQFEQPVSEEPIYFSFTDPEFPVTAGELSYARPGDTFDTVADFRNLMAQQLYVTMLNARLSERARAAEPPYLNAEVSIGDGIGGVQEFSFSVVTEDGQLETGFDALLEEAARVEQFGFTETELARAKQDVLASLEQNFAERDDLSSAFWRNAIIESHLRGLVVTSNEADLRLGEQLLPQIGLDEVNALTPDLNDPAGRVVLALGPSAELAGVPAEGELEAIIEAGLAQEVTAYQDDAPQGELLKAELNPVAIVSEDYIPDLDVTLFELENGVEVVFKPTDFTAEEVLVSGVSYGGTSQYEDEDFTNALYTTDIASEGGLAEYSLPQLERLLAGQNVSVSVSLGDLTENINGSAEVADLETLFQLIYLYATEPRFDEGALSRLQSQLRTSVQNRASQPRAALNDAINEAIYGDDVRYTPLTLEEVGGLSLDQAAEIYQERFSDFSDFSFTIVGDVSLDQVQDLAQRYLGNLPATGRTESWQNRVPPLPKGSQDVEVFRGLEEQAVLHQRFDGPFFDPEREQRFTLFVLERVLDLRMRNTIREELGGSYSPSVFTNYEQRPSKRYTVGAQFSADPQRVDELSEAAYEVFQSLRDEGVTEDELNRAKAQLSRDLEEGLESNRYWLSVLPFYFFFNPEDDPLVIVNFEGTLDAVSAEDVHDLARRFIVAERFTEVTLFPEAYQE